MPLSPLSCHAPSVLSSWPRNEVTRRAARSLSRTDQASFVRAFTSQYCSLHNLNEHELLQAPSLSLAKHRSASSLPRLILPFTRVWYSASLHSILRDVAQQEGFPSPSIGWKNFYLHLIVVLKRYNLSLSIWEDEHEVLKSWCV